MAGHGDQAGPSPKRPKSDKSSLDFTRHLPVEMCELIFGHFKAEEILEMSKVSPEWNKLIDSSTCMKNISLCLKERRLKLNDLETIQSSTRRYRNIEIDGVDGKIMEETLEVYTELVIRISAFLKSLTLKGTAHFPPE